MEDAPVNSVSIRMMLIDDAGAPKVPTRQEEYSKWGLLAVRPYNPEISNNRFDVSARLDTDLVGVTDPAASHPPEGLSCSKAPVDVYCERFRWPNKKERVWEIAASALPDGLTVIPNPQPDDPDHMLIVPSRPMTLGEFQSLLASTRLHWRVIQFPLPTP